MNIKFQSIKSKGEAREWEMTTIKVYKNAKSEEVQVSKNPYSDVENINKYTALSPPLNFYSLHPEATDRSGVILKRIIHRVFRLVFTHRSVQLKILS